jgi:excisionase family DNA binding protein
LNRASVEEFATWWQARQAEGSRRQQAKWEARKSLAPPDDGHVWLSAETTACVLGFSRQYLCRLAVQGRIPAVRRGRRWWFRRVDVEIYAAARALGVESPPLDGAGALVASGRAGR